MPAALQPAAGPAFTPDLDLPLRLSDADVARREATRATHARRAAIEQVLAAPGLALDDPDDWMYRRPGGRRLQTRDLSPMQHDRMLQLAWYLYEQNPFARRLIDLQSDLVLGEGTKVVAQDERIQAEVLRTWQEDMDVFSLHMVELHSNFSLNGELILPVTVNPFTGRPTFGFIDPISLDQVIPVENNVLIPDTLVLKSEDGIKKPQTFKVIRKNPATGRLEGDCFFFKCNGLVNARRGRSDLATLADWLDMYDTYLFAEVERLRLLSAFVWDLEVEGDQKDVNDAIADFPIEPKPGTLYAHTNKRKLEARTPDLQAAERSEVARTLRTHIAGTFGFPVSYLGDIDSNRATIEGQNDIMLKTPSRRQKQFGRIIREIVTFIVQSTVKTNAGLFRDLKDGFVVEMPEIAAKDIARVGSTLSSVVSAMDTAIAGNIVSTRVAQVVCAGLITHLGTEVNLEEMQKEIEEEKEERAAAALDQMQAALARVPKQANAPIPDDPDEEEAAA